MRIEFLDGVYYDSTVGDFYEYEIGDGGDVVVLIDPLDGEQVETLSVEEFEEIEDALFQVPDEAVENPVEYFVEFIGPLVEHGEFDAGFMFADRQTEVVEVDND